MTDFLLKIFVKDSENLSNPAVRARYGTFASVIGIIVNIFLSLAKLILGLISASISVTADALNNLSDAGASVLSFVGFKLSSKPADKEHPFGHARMEYITSLVVSFIILLVGAELLIDSVKTIFLGAETATKLGAPTYIILSLSILTKLWLALFCKKIAKRIDSTAIRASGTDALSDAIATSAVLISAIVMRITDFYLLDAIMGLLVSGIIIYAGLKILNETKNSLLGEAPTEEIVKNVTKIVAEYDDIIGIHDMMVHNYGPGHFIASFHAEVDGGDDIFKLHDTIDLVEKRIRDELDILCTIHMDPIDNNDETVSRLKNVLMSVISEPYPNITVHDFRVVTGETHTNMIFDIVVPFEESTDTKYIIEDICSRVSELDKKLFCVITVDRA